MARGRPKNPQADRGANTGTSGAMTGYEAELWQMADALRGSMDAAEYKHVVLGLIFLKYISDAFEERHVLLESEREQGADPEDPDEYRAENIFWVPSEARWTHLKAQAKQPTIGQLVDDAMTGIERDNPALKDVLPKDYARASPVAAEDADDRRGRKRQKATWATPRNTKFILCSNGSGYWYRQCRGCPPRQLPRLRDVDMWGAIFFAEEGEPY